MRRRSNSSNNINSIELGRVSGSLVLDVGANGTTVAWAIKPSTDVRSLEERLLCPTASPPISAARRQALWSLHLTRWSTPRQPPSGQFPV